MAASPSSANEWLQAQMSLSPGVEEKKGSMSGCEGPRQLSETCDQLGSGVEQKYVY
jgi:hypothetical protein